MVAVWPLVNSPHALRMTNNTLSTHILTQSDDSCWALCNREATTPSQMGCHHCKNQDVLPKRRKNNSC